MSSSTFRKMFGGLLAVVVLALTTACDGLIQVRGRVYAQQQPGSQSRAFVDRAPDDDLSGLTPLAGAKITLYHAGDFGKQHNDTSKMLKE